VSCIIRHGVDLGGVHKLTVLYRCGVNLAPVLRREKLRPLLARTNVTLFINQAVRLVILRVADLLRPWSVKAYLGRRAGVCG
jgi:hypothetical protein